MANQYLIVGSGRVARHLAEYLRLLQQPFVTWSRKHNGVSDCSSDYRQKAARASHILLCLSDAALAEFAAAHPVSSDKILVHFSGALDLPGVIGAHPLMTFGDELYSLETYKNIPFILTGPWELSQVLPGLPNRWFRLPAEEKSYYHALCVMGGNFTTLLWKEMRDGLRSLGLPAEVTAPYLEQILRNFLTSPDSALTGPLARKDFGTIEKNIKALQEHQDFGEKIYRAFTDVYLGRDL
jgi:predicted short-subunit dehydrogenase-like oxidoreductase (DUF2520 family)